MGKETNPQFVMTSFLVLSMMGSPEVVYSWRTGSKSMLNDTFTSNPIFLLVVQGRRSDLIASSMPLIAGRMGSSTIKGSNDKSFLGRLLSWYVCGKR